MVRMSGPVGMDQVVGIRRGRVSLRCHFFSGMSVVSRRISRPTQVPRQ